MKVNNNRDHISILDDNEDEVIYWEHTEWIEDPESVVPAIMNAIVLAFTDMNALKKKVGWTKN